MLRMQVYLPENLFVTLKSRAAVEEVSMSDLIRKGLEKILSMEGKKIDPMKEFIGKCKLKRKVNGVVEINKYYSKILK